MPGSTTERLDDDFRSLREDIRAIQVTLARIDSRMSDLDNLRVEVRANTASLAASDGRLGILESRLNTLINAGKWLGSIFALAALAAAFSIWGRLGVVEAQLKNFESRLVELRESVSRHQAESPARFEEQINRMARAAVDEAVRRANLPKPAP